MYTTGADGAGGAAGDPAGTGGPDEDCYGTESDAGSQHVGDIPGDQLVYIDPNDVHLGDEIILVEDECEQILQDYNSTGKISNWEPDSALFTHPKEPDIKKRIKEKF
jgi:hypothetical protein